MAHESLKAAYAEDAKRTEKPYLLWQVMETYEWLNLTSEWLNLTTKPLWVPSSYYRRHPHADKMLAYKKGDEWEYSCDGHIWYKAPTPAWNPHKQYRKKPMTHETERQQYEADKLTYNEPWMLWEFQSSNDSWLTLAHHPEWDSKAYRRKPEARPHAHLIKLWADGAEIQKLNHNNQWIPCPNPCWDASRVYRQKPAHQTRWIGIYRMPAGSVYIAEGKISREDCKPFEGDTLVKLLEVTVNADNSISMKEHPCD